MTKYSIAIGLLAIGCGSEGGIDVAGTYSVTEHNYESVQAADAFACSSAIPSSTSPDAFVKLSPDDFSGIGFELAHCETDAAACEDVFSGSFREATDNGWREENANSSLSGDLCGLYANRNTLVVMDDGGLHIRLEEMYKSGDPSDCSLEQAKALLDENTCIGVEEWVTAPL